MLVAGERAPEIVLPDLGGNPAKLSTLLASGAALIAFFKVSCPTCQFTFPYLQRLANVGIPVIGVSQDGVEATEAFRDRYDLRFQLWLDPAASGYLASNAYRITHVPSLFLVESDSVIVRSISGFSRDDLDAIGQKFGAAVFSEDEQVPVFRPG